MAWTAVAWDEVRHKTTAYRLRMSLMTDVNPEPVIEEQEEKKEDEQATEAEQEESDGVFGDVNAGPEEPED